MYFTSKVLCEIFRCEIYLEPSGVVYIVFILFLNEFWQASTPVVFKVVNIDL